MTDAKLKSLAERINRLLDEKQGIGADIADIFLEAKSAGYVPKVLRKAIARQRMEPAKRQEEDSILELYEAALDGPTRKALDMAAHGATARQIESATGISRSAVSRSVPLQNDGGTTAKSVGRSSEEADSGRDATPRPAPISVEQGDRQSPLREGGVSAGITTASASPSPPSAGVHTQFYGGAPVATSTAGPAVTTPSPDLPVLAADILALPPKQAAAVIAVLDALISEDDLAIRAHLRRVRA
jgi:uncharacterized protein (UPF0335 family)